MVDKTGDTASAETLREDVERLRADMAAIAKTLKNMGAEGGEQGLRAGARTGLNGRRARRQQAANNVGRRIEERPLTAVLTAFIPRRDPWRPDEPPLAVHRAARHECVGLAPAGAGRRRRRRGAAPGSDRIGLPVGALYLGLSTYAGPAWAALITGVLCLVVGGIVVLIGWLVLHSRTAPGPRRDRKPTEPPDVVRLALTMGESLGEELQVLAKRNRYGMLGAALVAGFALGASPKLRRSLRDLLDT